MILSDNETRLDLLNNRAIAKTIVSIIEESKESVSIGVHGDWGAGKSSILAMVEDLLNPQTAERKEDSNNEDDEEEWDDWSDCDDPDDAPEEEPAIPVSDVITVRFNSWQYQGFEDAKIALMSAIVKALQKRAKLYYKKHPVKRGFEKLKTISKRIWKNIDKLSIVKNTARIGVSIATGTAPLVLLEGLMKSAADAIGDQGKRDSFLDSVGKLFKDSSPEPSSYKEMSEFRANFADLYKAAHIKKLVVLIDDLDRCLPKVAIETLEAVRMFLSMEHAAFIIAADDAMIRYSVKEYFPRVMEPESEDTTRTLDYNRFSDKYLEKLIQIPFHIPRIGIAEAQLYILLLMVESILGEVDSLKKLADAAIIKLNKPWALEQFTTEEIRAVLGDQYDSVIDAMRIGKSIGKILAQNTGGNPRNIKRYVNMLLLRTTVAYNRGFSKDELAMPVLAKMMLAEQYYPDFYRALAAELREDGSCPSFDDATEVEPEAVVETAAPATENAKEKPKSSKRETKQAEPAQQGQFESMLRQDEIVTWANAEPSLAGIDLRPYFFACTEKEDFFFSSKEERLRDLIYAVRNGGMTTVSRKKQIEELPGNDAKYLFRIVSEEAFISKLSDSKAPKPIVGMQKLVSIRPELREDLAGFLLTLPVDNLGMWAVSGWDESIPKDSPQRSKLMEFVKKISEQSNDHLVKTAAKNALR